MWKLEKIKMKQQGIIKFFRKDSGYGFIETPTEDIFFHVSEVLDKTKVENSDGKSVEFDGNELKRGKTATNITVIGNTNGVIIKTGN